MTLKIANTIPTSIRYNGCDLTIVKYDNTSVWGKPYTLTIETDSYTTITINRTSSPNQHAFIGNLSSGDVVYYGDILNISATSNSNYAINTFTVNGINWTSGNTITITGAITVIGKSSASASWHTVFSGKVSAYNHQDISSKTYTLTANGVLGGSLPTRVSGTFSYYDSSVGIGGEGSSNINTTSTPATITNTGGIAIISTPTISNKINVTLQSYTFYDDAMTYQDVPYNVSVDITKIEQYY